MSVEGASPVELRLDLQRRGVVTILAVAAGLALSSAPPALAQTDDAAYCARLADLALRYTGSNGSDGRLAPTLETRTAIDDCRKGNTAAGIPVLERLLRGNGFTLPRR